MNSAALSMLSLARKAGKLKMGYDAVKSVLPETKLVVFAADISPKTRERMLYYLEDGYPKSVDITYTSDDIAWVVGKRVAVLAITDTGFAKAFLSKLSPPVAIKEEDLL